MARRVVSLAAPGSSTLLVVVGERLVVGRDCEGLLVADPAVSRRHLSVEPHEHGVLVTDLGSSNGTLVRGERISGPVVVARGEAVVFGDTTMTVEALEVVEPAAGRSTGEDARTAMRQTVMPAAAAGDDELRGTTVEARVRPAAGGGGGGGGVRATSIDAVAATVAGDAGARAKVEQLDAVTGGTLTFAFSDIESSTQLAEALGDTRWFDALRRHNRVIRDLVAEYGGTEIKAVGDGFMLTFPSATAAARCAAAVQRAISAEFAGDPAVPVRVRVGLHTGEAIEHGGDLFGKHVNVAARVANAANGGEVLVSALTREIAQAAGDLRFGDEREVELKGLAGTYRVVPLLWD